MSIQEVFEDSKTLILQGFLVAIIASGYALIIIDSDINFFDSYVLKIISECYPSNQEDHCIKWRKELGCGITDQLCLGNKYWNQVNKQAVSLAVLLFIFRMVPSVINRFTTRETPHLGQALAEASLWSFTAFALFMGAIIDVGYYSLRGISIPDTLPWLAHVGVFPYTAEWTGDPSVVERDDLYLTFLASLGTILFVWLVAIYLYSKTGLKRLA